MDGMKHSEPAEVEVWPFAVTRSVNTGFRIVAAPDFLVDEDRYSLLHDVTTGDPTDDSVYRREYRVRGSEPLRLLYRVVYLKASDVGLDGDYAMSGPRRTPLIEGVVCRTPSGPPATRELFAEVHSRCGADVRAFFEADSTTHPVSPFPSFAAPGTGETVRVADLDPYLADDPSLADAPYLAEGMDSTAPTGRRPSGIRRLAATALSAVLSALGLRTGRQAGTVPGEGGEGAGAPGYARGGGTSPGPARRLGRAAGAIVLTVLIVLLVRKFK
ncbi:hypothetical protein ACTMUQ_01865 [Streptomyces sp. SD11]|uniref:hypothetical protein n=1 Tax=Streptomyces sp. SD11 TaxID=3452209 RepID=UPI003F89AE3C